MTEPGPGDIGCVPIRGDVGWLISLGERLNGDAFAQYDHAFVAISSDSIIEAEPGGARERPLSEYDPRTIAWVRCPDEHRQTVADAAKALQGTKYGVMDYVALALHRFHIPIPGLLRYIDSDRSMDCSTLCVVAARRGGWNLLPEQPHAGLVTPADLAKLAEPAV
jgi:hypothetical protein